MMTNFIEKGRGKFGGGGIVSERIICTLVAEPGSSLCQQQMGQRPAETILLM